MTHKKKRSQDDAFKGEQPKLDGLQKRARLSEPNDTLKDEKTKAGKKRRQTTSAKHNTVTIYDDGSMVIGDKVTVYKNGVKLHGNDMKAVKKAFHDGMEAYYKGMDAYYDGMEAYHDGMEAYDNTSKTYRNTSKTNHRRHRKGTVSSEDKKGVKSSKSLAIEVEQNATK